MPLGWASRWPMCACAPLPLRFPRCVLPMRSCPNQAGCPSLVASLSQRRSPLHPQQISSTEDFYLICAQQDHLQGFLPSQAVAFTASHTFFPPMKGKSNVLHTDLPLVCSVPSHPTQSPSRLACPGQNRTDTGKSRLTPRMRREDRKGSTRLRLDTTPGTAWPDLPKGHWGRLGRDPSEVCPLTLSQSLN